MSERIQIEVPCVPVSGNRWQRMHWSQRKRISDVWNLALLTARVSEQHMPFLDNTEADTPRMVRVSATCYFGNGVRGKRMDQDNLETGLKPAFDALVRARYIRDDAPKYVERGKIEQVLERDPKKHRTVFTLEML